MATQEQTAEGARSRWRPLVWIVPAIVVGVPLVVFIARWFVSLPAVADFMRTYPGVSELPDWAPVGFPLWLSILHFLAGAFLLFIVLSGWTIRRTRRRGTRPQEFWIRDNDQLVRTRNPPIRITLTSWWHLTVDSVWVATGVLYIVLLFVSGHWVRVVPTRWDAIPNAISAALQYASMDWPSVNGWVNYNALQLLAYFVTVFVAAPLAVLTGIRLAPGFSAQWRRFDKAFPLPVARVIHVGVLVWFVAFTVVHVALVLLTGALRNLDHMYALRDDESWLGLIVFVASLIVIAIAWALLRPPRLDAVAELTGSVKRR